MSLPHPHTLRSRLLGPCLLLACAVACQGPPTPREPSVVTPQVPALDLETEDIPPPPPRGAVLSIVTSVGAGAAAATLDTVALIRLRLADDAGAEATLELPPGGGGVLHLAEVAPTATLWIELWSPLGVQVGGNAVAVDGLSGSIGVLGLELGVLSGGRRACLRCSAPEPLSEIRGLYDTLLLWSAGSEVVTGEPAQRLHVATHMRLSGEARRALIQAVGGQTETEAVDAPEALVWSVVAPGRQPDLLEIALHLAEQPDVRALELYERNRSGLLYGPVLPQPLGTGVGTGLD